MIDVGIKKPRPVYAATAIVTAMQSDCRNVRNRVRVYWLIIVPQPNCRCLTRQALFGTVGTFSNYAAFNTCRASRPA